MKCHKFVRFALLLVCLSIGLSGCNGTPSETSTAEGAIKFSAQYIRTNGYEDGAEFPRTVIIRSVEELNTYYEKNKDTFYLGRQDQVYSDTTIGFLDACDKYDEEYFKNQVLVMVLLEEGSGSVRHQITDVSIVENNQLSIAIKTITPEVCTEDMAEWHILIEPEAGVEITAVAEVIITH